jgi:hypothetical protein
MSSWVIFAGINLTKIKTILGLCELRLVEYSDTIVSGQ